MGRLLAFLVAVAIGCGILLTHLQSAPAAGEGERSPKQQAESAKENGNGGASPIRAAREEKALQDARRQQLTEKEASLSAKEQELKKLSAKLDAQLKSIEESRKRLEEGNKAKTAAQKKAQDEKILKMVKLFKTLKGEQAGKLIDSLPENQALALLTRMDTKTVAKLAPSISQPRVLKWISENINEQAP